jgi:hypothetical protein
MMSMLAEVNTRVREIVQELVCHKVFVTSELVLSILFDRYNVRGGSVEMCLQSLGVNRMEEIDVIAQLSAIRSRTDSFVGVFFANESREIKSYADLESELVSMLNLVGVRTLRTTQAAMPDRNEIDIDDTDIVDNTVKADDSGYDTIPTKYVEFGVGELCVHPQVRRWFPTLVAATTHRQLPTSLDITNLLVAYMEQHSVSQSAWTPAVINQFFNIQQFVSHLQYVYQVPDLHTVGIALCGSLTKEILHLNHVLNNRLQYSRELKELEVKAFEKKKQYLENMQYVKLLIAQPAESTTKEYGDVHADYASSRISLKTPTNEFVRELLVACRHHLNPEDDAKQVHSPSYSKVLDAVKTILSDGNKQVAKRAGNLSTSALEGTHKRRRRKSNNNDHEDIDEDNAATPEDHENNPSEHTDSSAYYHDNTFSLKEQLLNTVAEYMYLHLCSWKNFKRKLEADVTHETSSETKLSDDILHTAATKSIETRQIVDTRRYSSNHFKTIWTSQLDASTVSCSSTNFATYDASTLMTPFLRETYSTGHDASRFVSISVDCEKLHTGSTYMRDLIAQSVSSVPSDIDNNKTSDNIVTSMVGRWGEAFVYQLLVLSHPGASVQWVNEHTESRAPYDIILTLPAAPANAAANRNNTPQPKKVIYIEVKATRHSDNNTFDISLPEWEFATNLPRVTYAIARVFNVPVGDCKNIGKGSGGGVKVVFVPDLVKFVETQKVKLCVTL